MIKRISSWVLFFSLPGVILVTSTFIACAPKIRAHFLKAEEIQRIPTEFEETGNNRLQLLGRGPCTTASSYIPDTSHLDHTPIKHVRVNFHWMQPLDAVVDFPEEKVEEFSRGLLMACNYAMANNKAMWLPHNNDTPTLPIQIQYELTPQSNEAGDDGIYFHYDDELYYYVAKGSNRNLYDRRVINKFGIQLDSVLNIFFMPHHPDSVASKTYLAVGTGVALGNAIKLAGVNPEGDFWPYRGVFNHEVGHIFGLSHTWAYNDGCDDTPRHKQNCWNRDQPGCATNTSNNVMDYNALQLAWTPCQIGKVHQRMSDIRAKARNFLSPTWCSLDEEKTIVIQDTINWTGARDLEGNLVIAPGGQLSIACRVSVPPGGKITVEPGGTLILNGATLHNACNEEWQGIEIQELEEQKGMVRYLQEPTIENVKHKIELVLE